MRVAIACDHVGFGLKAAVVAALEHDDHAVLDLGAHGPAPAEYPPLARTLAAAVGKNFVDRGILLCASGPGGAIVANRLSGIRAVAGGDPRTAREGREALDANVLCVSAAGLELDGVLAVVKEWTSADFAATDAAAAVLAAIAEAGGAAPPRSASPPPPAPATPAPAAAAPAPAAASPAPAAAPAPAPAAAAAEAPRAPDIKEVMKVVASVTEPEVKALATRVLQFVRNRFPTAAGVPTDHGFTFTLGGEHVASVILGKNYLELEAGPERASTGKIRDLERLEVVLSLPSVTGAFDALKG